MGTRVKWWYDKCGDGFMLPLRPIEFLDMHSHKDRGNEFKMKTVSIHNLLPICIPTEDRGNEIQLDQGSGA
jgi:hypothetical protein